MSISRRHHYIPEFFTKGFFNSDGVAYVYNKAKDTIRRISSPKQIFFEWNRNTTNTTVDEDTEEIDIIEESYGPIDTGCSKIINSLLTYEVSKELVLKHYPGIQFFILIQFCRIPKNDNKITELLKRGTVKLVYKNGEVVHDKEFEKFYLENISALKHHRFALPKEIVKRLNISPREDIKFGVTEFMSRGDYFLLGDYPMVFSSDSGVLTDFMNKPVMMPISSRRVYFVVDNMSFEFTEEKALDLNALIIDQATNYICGPTRHTLQTCVEYYKYLKSMNAIEFIKHNLFNQ